MEIVCIKAVTGEQLIATKRAKKSVFVEGVDDHLVEYADVKVAQMFEHPQQRGQMLLNLMPWVQFKPTQIVDAQTWSDMTIVEFEAPVELERAYMRAVTGIEIARG